ncbi:hypothetical protein V5799_012799 [Amblyomma americanum]|uniref:Uncharacterized protein n=1 Tax=Amblyomma americanum TaxID=6943 RepID=A0AAQ4E7P2_AMBAM
MSVSFRSFFAVSFPEMGYACKKTPLSDVRDSRCSERGGQRTPRLRSPPSDSCICLVSGEATCDCFTVT